MSNHNDELVDMVISFQSNDDIITIGKKISDLVLGGVEFCGLNENIHEEIPCVYIPKIVLGFTICLDGYKGYDTKKGEWYSLYFEQNADMDILLSHSQDIQNTIFSNEFREYLKILISQIPDVRLID